MNYRIFRKRDQASGAFDGGRILENKPIGFPHEGGITRPYSNLFYWAHAWSDVGGLIDVHPHQGFEIMSFVIKGTIEHYDSQMQGWKKLHEGGAQIIRAGNGITHAEKFLPGAHIFQIWVDPDLTKTLGQKASYDDYGIEAFPVRKIAEGRSEKVYHGQDGPMTMDAQGLIFKEVILEPGTYSFDVGENSGHANYLIEGRVKLGNEELVEDDFFQINEGLYEMEVVENSRIFQVETPNIVNYRTYAQLQGVSA